MTPAPAAWGGVSTEPPQVALSALEHYAYGARQAGLILLEDAFTDDASTVRGTLMHQKVDTTSTEGQRRLRRIARLCEGYGIRVQKSVFEIVINEVSFLKLLDRADRIINPDLDSIRAYRLPARGFDTVTTLGTAQLTPHRSAHIL